MLSSIGLPYYQNSIILVALPIRTKIAQRIQISPAPAPSKVHLHSHHITLNAFRIIQRRLRFLVCAGSSCFSSIRMIFDDPSVIVGIAESLVLVEVSSPLCSAADWSSEDCSANFNLIGRVAFSLLPDGVSPLSIRFLRRWKFDRIRSFVFFDL